MACDKQAIIVEGAEQEVVKRPQRSFTMAFTLVAVLCALVAGGAISGYIIKRIDHLETQVKDSNTI